jgi:hypothetical protein
MGKATLISSTSFGYRFRWLAGVTISCALGLAASAVQAKSWTLQSGRGVRFTLASTTGHYRLVCPQTHWVYRGKMAKPPQNIRQSAVDTRLGKGFRLSWKEPGSSAQYAVELYPSRQAIVFSAKAESAGARFPVFTRVPHGLLHLSLESRVFTPPQFQLADTATPWVFFNRKFQTCIFAPASEILVSRLYGDGNTLMADGFNQGVLGAALKEPHRTIMIFGNGIRRTIAAWGDAFRRLNHRPATSQEATPILRDFGYWTDNGANYFYNYDKAYGYAGTLLKIASEFRKDHIHLGYMELDSWWYDKSHHFFNGQKIGPMNPHLPTNNRWNYFGGTWLYHAAHQLFPKGLNAFHHQIGLPLVVHARWIARHSPYHRQYRISGIAAADRSYWRSRAKYLASGGVRVMEQDWLIDIYGHSPQLHVHLSLARDFTHGMASAMASRHISVIYCMETARFLMEAGVLPDVIAMRGADDRFVKARWRNFIYNSMFIHAVGAWPWSDVFMSHERGNMLLSLLSGGPVGVGDKLGRIDPKNIDMATRADGRLVKPAVPLMPTDQTIVNDALGRKIPLVASTHTGRHIRSTLVFVFRRRGDHSTVILTPRSLGLDPHGVWIARNYFTGKTVLFNRDHTIRVTLAPHKWAYWVLAPLLPSRMAFFGDLQQMVPAGRQRIAHLANIAGVHSGVGMQVVFAIGEKGVPLTFYSFHTPEATANGHMLPISESTRISHLFHVMIPVKYAKQQGLRHHKVVRLANTLILNSGE